MKLHFAPKVWPWPNCVICNKPVDGINLKQNGRKLLFLVMCHGEVDSCELDEIDQIYFCQLSDKAFENKPKPALLTHEEIALSIALFESAMIEDDGIRMFGRTPIEGLRKQLDLSPSDPFPNEEKPDKIEEK